MKVKKIDMHVHAIPKRGIPKMSGAFYPTPSELRRMYDKLGIEKGVLLPPGTSPEFTTERVSASEARQMTLDFPDTLGWWFCGIDPRFGSNSKNTDFSHYLNYYKSLGARGVSEQVANIYLDDDRMLNLLYHCEKCNMPIVFHFGKLGNDYGIVDDLHLPRLEKILKMFPNLKAIGHSVRFWSELDDDVTEETCNSYPKGKVRGGGRVLYLMKNYKNLYCDLSSRSGFNAISRDEEFACEFLTEFNDRVLFATDIHDPNNINHEMVNLSAFLDRLLDEQKISQTVYENVCRNNALFLLGENVR